MLLNSQWRFSEALRMMNESKGMANIILPGR
jgi:hypothetical protein